MSFMNYQNNPRTNSNYAMDWGLGSNNTLSTPQSSSIMGLQTMPDVTSMGLLNNALSAPQAAATPGLFENIKNWGRESGFLGSTDANGIKTDGWGGMALGAAQGIGNFYMGMKQYGLAKDTLAENKRQFALNYDAQRKATNSRLETQRNARVAANPNAYQSENEYMNKYRIA